MTGRPAQLLRSLALALLFGAWAIAAHHGSSGNGSADFNAALGVLPIAAVALLLLWRLPALPRSVGGLAGLGLLVTLWPQLRDNVALLYYLQHLGTHLALATLFGRSLFGPGEALITRIARRVFNGQLSPRKVRYTRQVTVAWTAFFLGNALLSTGLFLFAPPAIWSIHANLLTAPLIGLMFIGEHLVRLRVLPAGERPGFLAAIRAYRHGTQQADVGGEPR